MHAHEDNKKKEDRMKTKTRIKTWLLAALFTLAAALTVGAPGVANAVGTASGTSITNRATINYQVGGVAQTLIESSPTGNATRGAGNGTNTAFVVDNKVNLTVVSNDAALVTTYPGSAAIALKFTVTNTGNTTQDFGLSVITGTTNEGGVWPTAMYEDTDSSGTYNAGDAAITYIDELAADGAKVVFIVATPLLSATNGQRNTYALSAQARNGGAAAAQGAVTTATAGADTPASVDVVLAEADSDGAAADDAAQYNGIYVMWATGTAGSGEPGVGTGGYIVSAALLTITKTSAVVWDPINAAVNPKAIPTARVEYTVTIANAAGAATATSVTITDAIPANTTFYTAGYGALTGIQVTSPNLYGGAATPLTNASDADEGDYNVTTAGAVTVSGISVTAGQTATVKFMVTIN